MAVAKAKKAAAKKSAGKKAAAPAAQIPLVDYLKLGEQPYLSANECKSCGARFFDRRNACANCFGTEFKKARVKSRGEVKAFTIVAIAAPGSPAVRVGHRRLRRHQRPGQPDQRRTRSRACHARDAGEAGHLLHGCRRRGHRVHRVRLRTRLTSKRRNMSRTERASASQKAKGSQCSEDIWILGANMTKFGKYPERDTVDLAAEATMAALADGGVTMADVGVIAAGNLMAAGAGIGQQLQKQIGQTGIPVYNVANACATGATALRVAIMAVRPASVTSASRSVSRSWPARACWRQGAGEPAIRHVEAVGRFGAVCCSDGRDRHRDHAGRVRPGGHGVRPQVRRRRASSCSPGSPRRIMRTRR